MTEMDAVDDGNGRCGWTEMDGVDDGNGRCG